MDKFHSDTVSEPKTAAHGTREAALFVVQSFGQPRI